MKLLKVILVLLVLGVTNLANADDYDVSNPASTEFILKLHDSGNANSAAADGLILGSLEGYVGGVAATVASTIAMYGNPAKGDVDRAYRKSFEYMVSCPIWKGTRGDAVAAWISYARGSRFKGTVYLRVIVSFMLDNCLKEITKTNALIVSDPEAKEKADEKVTS